MATIADIELDPPEEELPDSTPTVLSLSEDGSAFEALASQTAREMVSALAESTATASELATAVDTSVQNATYHLSRLQGAGLVASVGTKFSTRGREMTVYGLDGRTCVIVVGDVTDGDAVTLTDGTDDSC
jgi:DNA-binding transcriptional ArsR family regulator